MRTLLSLLLLSAVSCFGQITNLGFTWDISQNASGYKFYEVQGTNRLLLLGTSLLNSFVVSNWNVSTSRTVTVTATNMIGETTNAPYLTVPPSPTMPLNLKPIPLSIVTPVPGVIELSHDLADWTERIRVSAGPTSAVMLTWIQYPKEPMLFLRLRPPAIPPPLP